MELIYYGYSCFYIVALFSGLLHQCSSQEPKDCLKDTLQYENSCYWVSGYYVRSTWENAQMVCNVFGGNLATIPNKATLEFLNSHWNLTNKLFWIGMYLNESVTSDDFMANRRANWKWLDGTKYDWTKYEQQPNFGWENGEPNKEENVVHLSYRQTWRATATTTQVVAGYICQEDLSDAVSPTSTSSTTSTSTTSTSSTTSTPSITTPSTTTPSITSSKQDMPEGMSTQNQAHVTSGPNSSCELNWMYNETTKLCYILRISELTLSWTDAEDNCKNAGGHLASLSTQERHDAAVAIIRGKKVYNQDVRIGLMYEEGASVWKWTDGSPYMFQKWAANEPNPGKKYGRLMGGEWRAINNGYYNNHLCQKEPMKSMSPDVPGSTPMQNEAPSPTDKMGVSGGSSGSDKSRIIGPVFGVLGGAIIIALVGLVIFMKRQRETQFNALMHRLRIDQWFKKSTKPEEPYCDIKDEDMDKHHVYYNETGDRGPQSRNSSLGNETTISPASVQQVPSDVPIDDLYELSLKPEHEYTPLQRIHRRTE